MRRVTGQRFQTACCFLFCLDVSDLPPEISFPQVTGHLAPDIGAHTRTHACIHSPRTLPPPTSWALSLVWVTCPAPPDLGQPPSKTPPPLARPAVIKLQRIRLLSPPWTSHSFIWAVQSHGSRTGEHRGENGGERKCNQEELEKLNLFRQDVR